MISAEIHQSLREAKGWVVLSMEQTVREKGLREFTLAVVCLTATLAAQRHGVALPAVMIGAAASYKAWHDSVAESLRPILRLSKQNKTKKGSVFNYG